MKAIALAGALLVTGVGAAGVSAVSMWIGPKPEDPAVAACEYFLKRRVYTPSEYSRVDYEFGGSNVTITFDAPNAYGTMRRGSETCFYQFWDGKFTFAIDMVKLMHDEDSVLSDQENLIKNALVVIQEEETMMRPSQDENNLAKCVEAVSLTEKIDGVPRKNDLNIVVSGNRKNDRLIYEIQKNPHAEPRGFPTKFTCSFVGDGKTYLQVEEPAEPNV